MSEPTFCTYCGAELEFAREYAYQYELRNFSGEGNEPVRTCQKCVASLETHAEDMRELDEAVDRDGQRFWLITMIAAAVLAMCCLVSSIFSCAAQYVVPR